MRLLEFASSGLGSDMEYCTARSRTGRLESAIFSYHTWSHHRSMCKSHSLTSPCPLLTWAFTSLFLRKCSAQPWTLTVLPGWTSSTVVSSSKQSTIYSLESLVTIFEKPKNLSENSAAKSRFRMPSSHLSMVTRKSSRV